MLKVVLIVFSMTMVGCIGDDLKTDVVQEDADSSSSVSATVEESPVSETSLAEENPVAEESSVSSEEAGEVTEETAVETPAAVAAEPAVVETPAVALTPAQEPAITETTTVSASNTCSPDVESYMQPLIASDSVSQNENQTYSISGAGCDDGIVTFQKRNGDVMPIVAFGLAGECRFEVHYTYHFSAENLVKEKSRSQCVNQEWSAWKTY